MIRTAGIIFLLIHVLEAPAPAFAQASFAGRDSLPPTVWITPGDLWAEIPQWDRTTTDGYTYRLNTGDYGFYGPQPTLYLDGIPLEITFMGWQNIQMLPVAAADIRRIRPRNSDHTPAKAGALYIQTASPDSGLHVLSSVSYGNKIEDPGPWIYDSTKVTPNINRWGVNLAAGASYRSGNWFGKTYFSFRQHQPTTLINHRRIGSYYPVESDWPSIKTRLLNGLAEAGYTFRNWKVRGRLIQSDNLDYIFFQPLGREIPAHPVYRQMALTGSYRWNGWTFNGRYRVDQKNIRYRPNNKNYRFDWHQWKHSLSFSGSFREESLYLDTGSNLQLTTTSPAGLDYHREGVLSIFGNLKTRLNSDLLLSPAFNLDISDNHLASTFSVDAVYQMARPWKTAVAATYSELLPSRRQNSAFWVSKGYSLYSELNIPYLYAHSPEVNRLLKLGMRNDLDLSGAFNLRLWGRYTHHVALSIPWQTASYHSRLMTAPGLFEYTTEKGGRFFLQFELNQQSSRFFGHSLTAITRHTLRGTERYSAYWKQIPAWKLRYRLELQPALDIRLSFAATYHSSTRWLEFSRLEGRSYRSLHPQYPYQRDTYHMRTPRFLNLRLDLKKWLWDRRFSTTFSFRNLLNQEIRTHTLGPDLALRFVLKATLQL